MPFLVHLGEFSLDRERKEQEIKNLQEKFSKAQASFLVNFKGTNVSEVTNLRKELIKAGAEFRVVRNTLAKVSLKKGAKELATLEDYFTGPKCGCICF